MDYLIKHLKPALPEDTDELVVFSVSENRLRKRAISTIGTPAAAAAEAEDESE